MGRWTARTVLFGATLVALAFAGGVAEAAFPGQNGKIAHTYGPGIDIWSIDPDGSDATQLTSGPAWDLHPSWSPDGERIAFMSSRADPSPVSCFPSCVWEMYVVNADGTGLGQITDLATQTTRWPWGVWSPDGERIAYVSSDGHVWTVGADGSDPQRVSGERGPGCDTVFQGPFTWSPDGTQLGTAGSVDCTDQPVNCLLTVASGGTSCWEAVADSIADWSPDSHWVLIGSDGASYPGAGAGLWRRKVRPPGAGQTVVLTPGWQADDGLEGDAAWSPDGTTVIFRHDVWDGPGSGVYLAHASDGGNTRPFPGPIGCCYDWQSIPINAYPRPKAASPTQVSLVPAYEPCSSPNRTHGPPLAFGSCNPPQGTSSALTVGTPDANGQPSKSKAEVWLRARPGNPATPEDEADVRLSGSITDVRVASDLSDYTGTLEARVSLRITDKDNTPHPGGPGAATVQDFAYSFPIPCAGTADTAVGGDCAFDTTADVFVPGAVKERRRAVWQLGPVRVHDHEGALFLTQGVFVP